MDNHLSTNMENSPNGGFTSNFKKRRWLGGEISSPKKLKINDGEDGKSCTPISITDLPDDVLLIIFANLDVHGLSQLNKTCTLFSRLCADFTFWRNVQFTYEPATIDDMKYISCTVYEDTTSMHIRGAANECHSQSDIVTNDWLSCIKGKCPNLKTLILPYHSFDCKVITLLSFPNTLTCLDLSNTFIRGNLIGRSYFRDISTIMPELKILNLSNCSWFEPHSLMAISKCKKLEEFRINDCIQVHDCLAYCGLSTRVGFKSLITLDLRRCSISNSELFCFCSVVTLKNVYLEFNEESSITINGALVAMCLDKCEEIWERYDDDGEMDRIHLEHLVVRNYKTLTDGFFKDFALRPSSLKVIDITGSNVSLSVIEEIRAIRPELKIISE